MKKTEKKNSFMLNVAIVMFSQIAVKLLGMIYRVVITNFDGFGDLGTGYLNVGFQIYTLLLAISSIGIPNAISKMTSERIALGDYRGAHKIFRSAMVLFSIVGVAASAFLYFGSGFIADYIVHLPDTKYVMMCLAPSILFVCLSSVIRGYFVGMENMQATSTSQVLEQFFKCFLTIAIVFLLAKFPSILLNLFGVAEEDENTRAVFMASGAQVATTLSTIISFIYLGIFYGRRRKKIAERLGASEAETLTKPIGQMFKSILLISIPISLGSVISAVNRIIDTATVTRGIEIAFSAMIPAYGNTPAVINPTLTQLSREAARLSGLLSKSDTLINLPLAINISFSTVLVPSIAGALAKGDKKSAADKIAYSLMISILIALPCAFGYIALGKGIYGFLYPNASLGYDLLQISAVAMIFMALNQTLSGSLQGVGKVFVPATGLLLGCIVKFILNVLLIRRPNINIYGAPISSIACQIISFAYSFTMLSRRVKIKIAPWKLIIKPTAAAAIMGLCSYAIHALLTPVIGNAVALMAAIAAAVVVYFALIFAFKVMTAEEIAQLPAGNKILKVLKKLKLYK